VLKKEIEKGERGKRKEKKADEKGNKKGKAFSYSAF
jgi:hypothetical protein